jgi:hypothetical protein
MAEPTGFTEFYAELDAAVDAALAQARRAAAEARETSAKFRRETRQLADDVATRTADARPDNLTDERLRRTATGFRTDHGLPVRDLPSGHELLAPPTPATAEPDTPRPQRTTGSSRRFAPPSDDDEDFSQERIMW